MGKSPKEKIKEFDGLNESYLSGPSLGGLMMVMASAFGLTFNKPITSTTDLIGRYLSPGTVEYINNNFTNSFYYSLISLGLLGTAYGFKLRYDNHKQKEKFLDSLEVRCQD